MFVQDESLEKSVQSFSTKHESGLSREEKQNKKNTHLLCSSKIFSIRGRSIHQENSHEGSTLRFTDLFLFSFFFSS